MEQETQTPHNEEYDIKENILVNLKKNIKN